MKIVFNLLLVQCHTARGSAVIFFLVSVEANSQQYNSLFPKSVPIVCNSMLPACSVRASRCRCETRHKTMCFVTL